MAWLDPSKVKYLVVHCADTTVNMDIGAKEINEWHKARGWDGIGYHYVIRRNGKIENGRALTVRGAHVEGYNGQSIGVCLVGGAKKGAGGKLTPESNFTPEQWATLKDLLLGLTKKFPGAVPVGHNDLTDKKACPSFKVADWIKTLPSGTFS
jgi:N-acetylmuramoyl-L-alanine amidase